MASVEDSHLVEQVIKFRESVAQEFKGLVRGVQVDDLLELGCFHYRGSFGVAVDQGRAKARSDVMGDLTFEIVAVRALSPQTQGF